MRTLLDSNFYSILYYNAVIWLFPEIGAPTKQALLSISANALRSCVMYNCSEISFINIHSICKKCTPNQIMLHENALQLHKSVNEVYNVSTTELVFVLDNIISTCRQTTFEIARSNRFKIGMNTTSNKFYYLNKQISLAALNLTFVHFKKLEDPILKVREDLIVCYAPQSPPPPPYIMYIDYLNNVQMTSNQLKLY